MQEKLTDRERTIFNMLLEGISPKEIAYKLDRSYSAVDFHRSNIYKKLGVHSIRELRVKYSFAGQYAKAASSVESQTAFTANKKTKRFRRLILLGLLVFVISELFVWRLLIKPSDSIISDTFDSKITLPDRSAFIARTWDSVYLRAVRFVSHEDDDNSGEIYCSGDYIKLNDIYPAGFDSFLPLGGGIRELRISGYVDKKLERMIIDFQHVKSESSDWRTCTYIGGSPWTNAVGNWTEIGPGNFSVKFAVRRLFDKPISMLPDGEIHVQLVHVLSNIHTANQRPYDFDSGERIPDDIPDGTIMAVIRNLKIEPVLE
jgi:DNA-binding CsgD family transcriptional regulator